MRIGVFSVIVFSIASFFPPNQYVCADSKVSVVVTILPLAEFVEQIGRDKVKVSVMIPPGAEPHTYEPTPNQLKEISTADLYVKVGTGLEFELYWLDKLLGLNKTIRLCDSSSGVELLSMNADAHDGHAHGFADPHIWLSPIRVVTMAENIENALSDIDPSHAQFYKANTRDFISRLQALDTKIKNKLAAFAGRAFLVVHPEWGYLAADYSLEQISMEKEGKELTAQEISEILKRAKEKCIRAVLTSPQFSRKTAEVIAKEINAKPIVTDALAKDYLENLRRVTDQLVNAFQ